MLHCNVTAQDNISVRVHTCKYGQKTTTSDHFLKSPQIPVSHTYILGRTTTYIMFISKIKGHISHLKLYPFSLRSQQFIMVQLLNPHRFLAAEFLQNFELLSLGKCLAVQVQCATNPEQHLVRCTEILSLGSASHSNEDSRGSEQSEPKK